MGEFVALLIIWSAYKCPHITLRSFVTAESMISTEIGSVMPWNRKWRGSWRNWIIMWVFNVLIGKDQATVHLRAVWFRRHRCQFSSLSSSSARSIECKNWTLQCARNARANNYMPLITANRTQSPTTIDLRVPSDIAAGNRFPRPVHTARYVRQQIVELPPRGSGTIPWTAMSTIWHTYKWYTHTHTAFAFLQ